MALSFEDKLNATALEIESFLDRLLPLEATQARRLIEAMRYAVLGGGKRLRPFLVLESAALFDAPRGRALRVGAALECVHCYSLIHDDLPAMDNDDVRRGKPTVHRAYDEATAILAGDALLTYGFEVLADYETHPGPAIRLALVQRLARAAGMAGMAGGQMLDIAGESGVKSERSGISLIQSMKTGALFRFACESGAVLGGADPTPLRRFADEIGLAFQITDDILDVESTPEALGKATQKDKGKATFAGLLGVAEAKRRANELVESAIGALEPYGSKADNLREAARFMVSRQM